MSVQQLQQSVTELTGQELKEFSDWLDEYMADQWDARIEKDAAEGKFDAIIQRVRENHRGGLSTPL